MVLGKTYSDYIEYNEKFSAVIDEEKITSGTVDWKNFYPHDTFVGLARSTLNILEGRERGSTWVEGSYGTGKTYAVLVLKKMLDLPYSEIEDYFKLNSEFGVEIPKRFENLKNKKILTVYTQGTSSINSDQDLINVIQEKIIAELRLKGYSPSSETVKESIIRWLSTKRGAAYFNSILAEANYSVELQNCTSSEQLITLLSTHKYEDVEGVIRKIISLSEKENINIGAVNSIDSLKKWITEIIKSNELDCILFIWDEFTEYFINNRNSLTGFQSLLHYTESNKFSLMIVSHAGSALFGETNPAAKIIDRFTAKCVIRLPESRAFKLMAQAIKKKPDEGLRKEWDNYLLSIYSNLNASTKAILDRYSDLTEEDLKAIYPITPYTALVLKSFSTLFKSDQRSMFDFLQSSKKEDVQAFQWFIRNTGFYDDWNVLTIDGLWDYFYTHGKIGLEQETNNILCAYEFNYKVLDNEKQHKIYKAILLLFAIAYRTDNKSQLFRPTEENLRYAFEGTPIENDLSNELERLCSKQLIIKVESEGTIEYHTGTDNDYENVSRQIEEQCKIITTKNILQDCSTLIEEHVKLDNELSRYKVYWASKDTLNLRIQSAIDNYNKNPNSMDAIFVFATTDAEAFDASKEIHEKKLSDYPGIVLIDATSSYFGTENVHKYVQDLMWEQHHQTQHNTKEQQGFADRKVALIRQWMESILASKFTVYSKTLTGEVVHTFNSLKDCLLQIILNRFPLGFEHLRISRSIFYGDKNIPAGAKCGITEVTVNKFRTPNKLFEKAFESVFGVKNYWKDSHLEKDPIVKMKKELESFIQPHFEKNEPVSLEDIVDKLLNEPFGFYSSDIAAFTTGFLLKEYVCGDYVLTHGLGPIENTPDNFAEAIRSTYMDRFNPNANKKYKPYTISPVSDNILGFYKMSATIFGFSLVNNIDECTSYIVASMRNLPAPLWAITYYDVNLIDDDITLDILDSYHNDFLKSCTFFEARTF